MSSVICPKCGTENPATATNCRECRINLKFALEHPEEAGRSATTEAVTRQEPSLPETPQDAGRTPAVLPEMPPSAFHETAAAQSRRKNIGIVALLLVPPLAGCGIWVMTGSARDITLVCSGIGGVLVGLLALVWGIHGLGSKPVWTISDQGLALSGYLLPNSNWRLSWSEIGHAKVQGAAPSQALIFYSADEPPKILKVVGGAVQVEHFDQLVSLAGERLAQLGRPIETGQPSQSGQEP
jgi:hypothetical protein